MASPTTPPPTGLNDYFRIMLAWDLEPALIEKARANKQLGGREKGWSNLTKAEQVHVRSEIAKAADVSTGNVTKVKQLNETCVPEIVAALRDKEISIHWAWKLRNEAMKTNSMPWAIFGSRRDVERRPKACRS